MKVSWPFPSVDSAEETCTLHAVGLQPEAMQKSIANDPGLGFLFSYSCSPVSSAF